MPEPADGSVHTFLPGRVVLGAGTLDRVAGEAEHVPTEVADEAREKAGTVRADGLVAIGGGSAADRGGADNLCGVANALAQCVEAVWTTKADPITDTTAVEGARTLAAGLRQLLREPTDLDARSNLCHLLGGAYNLPHAETHAAVLQAREAARSFTTPLASTEILEDILTRAWAGTRPEGVTR